MHCQHCNSKQKPVVKHVPVVMMALNFNTGEYSEVPITNSEALVIYCSDCQKVWTNMHICYN